ncbi:unnamed protein product [marine sediment metagenome]|uniref:Uncharacterized protein n=1 Tax=marine sediment metagenome TaxID=412755 RepID=X0VS30_9ZZZZ
MAFRLIYNLYREEFQKVVNYCCDKAYTLGWKRGYNRGWDERGRKEA